LAWELKSIDDQTDSDTDLRKDLTEQSDATHARRDEVRTAVHNTSGELRAMERTHASLGSETMESRLRFSEVQQKTQMMERELEPMEARLAQVESMVASRATDIEEAEKAVGRLEKAIAAAESEIPALEVKVTGLASRLEEARKRRTHAEERMEESGGTLSVRMTLADELRGTRSELEVKHAEARMQRENLIERITHEYSLSIEDFQDEPEPDWEGTEPGPEELDTRVAELRTKLDAMGAVNLVAIEEYQELEERYAFLNQQQDDLVNARQKLLTVISKINRTIGEMFAETFDKINENFDSMFKKLFNGGTAKLVLVNEEDVLESGIEIIARPPGKRLQNISLLSGGERTMTALSLLFAIYMVRPSPFCVLDELDAPLDDSNIGRFIRILQGFLDQSQFLIITHNQQTISSADVIYGVTMEEKGVSKVMSMKFVGNDAESDVAEEPVAT